MFLKTFSSYCRSTVYSAHTQATCISFGDKEEELSSFASILRR
ncbi:hypothetical protein CIPAW_04G023000 [Carya illinoinensis]|uniref:Uncharacterized protein n=1 Tax=Carya illinoinensis TaxID=32201 RepID=A0A8T1QPT0_CARIL|nr:hypothetical protein CIPAW_04G023000 [Carya illinoinensis]